MRPELDAQLCERHPQIFAQRWADAEPSNALVCFGIECSDGWYDLIDVLCSSIQNHIDSTMEHRRWAMDHNHKKDIDDRPRDVPDQVPQVVAHQIKEKFGTLRFYSTGGDDVTNGMISMAENLSARTCERCGAPGKSRGGVWIRTLCDQHHMASALDARDDFLS